MRYSSEEYSKASMDAEYTKAAFRYSAWRALFLTSVFSALALISLPLRQALLVVVPLALLSLAVVRKHGRRRDKDRPRNRR
jgi:membrane protein implicated in regulation of membrane protease activity